MNPTLVRWLQAPSIVLLLIWMIVPLAMTLYFSTQRFNLLYPERTGFIGLSNYKFFWTDPSFMPALLNTLVLVGSVLTITVVLGLAVSLLIDREFKGRGIARVMLISPFFIMPTVSALVWKNMLMDPNNGLFAAFSNALGFTPVQWLQDMPLFSIIVMISWQWTPFAILIFMTSLQSQDQEQMEAAELDGASFFSKFYNLTIPHLARPISIVILIQMIFHLATFAEIFVTTSGGPGVQSTNLTYLIYIQSQQAFDVGVASAGGVFAIILANIVAIFLIRAVGKTLTV